MAGLNFLQNLRANPEVKAHFTLSGDYYNRELSGIKYWGFLYLGLGIQSCVQQEHEIHPIWDSIYDNVKDWMCVFVYVCGPEQDIMVWYLMEGCGKQRGCCYKN